MSEINLATKGYVDTKFNSDALMILDTIYPVGSIVFGNHPSVGTWERYDFGGVVYSDAALTDGQAMTEALPNITGNNSAGMVSHHSATVGSGALKFVYEGKANGMVYAAADQPYGKITMNASDSEPTYGATHETGYKVQMKGKNTPAWIRTA